MGRYVRNYTDLPEILRQERESGKRIVLTGGCFDLLHPGHLYLFRTARELGDILVVNVANDQRIRLVKGEPRPINTEYKRVRVVSAVEAVDYAIVHSEINSNPTLALAYEIRPDVIVQSPEKWTAEDKSRLRAALGESLVLVDIERKNLGDTTSIIEKIQKAGRLNGS